VINSLGTWWRSENDPRSLAGGRAGLLPLPCAGHDGRSGWPTKADTLTSRRQRAPTWLKRRVGAGEGLPRVLAPGGREGAVVQYAVSGITHHLFLELEGML
jgi:hypothetical protein